MGFCALLHYLFYNKVSRLPFFNRHISWENINMENKKEKKPTKKALMKEIETLHNGRFDLVSLNRTNIANIKAIAEMLKA